MAASAAFTLRDAVGARQGVPLHPVRLPWKTGHDGFFVLKGTVDRHWWSRPVLHVSRSRTTAQFLVNGRTVTPRVIDDTGGAQDGGVDLDFSDVLAPGPNAFEIHFTNVYTAFGGVRLAAGSVTRDLRTVALAAGAALSAAIVLWLLLRPLRLPSAIRLLVCASLLAQLFYFSGTGPLERSSDAESHLAYVEYVAREHRLPSHDDCFECHQPPLYFAVAAAITQGARAAGFPDEKRILQLFSVVCATVFLVYATRTLGLFLPQVLPWAAMTALVGFFPSQLLHAPRIGNDTLLYAMMAAMFFHLCRWWRDGRERTARDYRTALLLGCIGLSVKANAIVMLALQGVLHLWATFAELRQGKGVAGGAATGAAWWRREVGLGACMLACVALALMLSFSRTLLDRARGIDAPLGIGKGMTIDEAQRVGTALPNLIGFDVASYLEVPYPNPYRDETGRQQFLPYLFKTAMFGEFRVEGSLALALARAMEVVFLLLVAWAAAGLVRALLGSDAETLLPASAGTALQLAALLVFHLATPLACTIHWRLIVPVILPLTVLMGTFWQALRTRGRWRRAIDAVFTVPVVVFCLLSVAHWSLPVIAYHWP